MPCSDLDCSLDSEMTDVCGDDVEMTHTDERDEAEPLMFEMDLDDDFATVTPMELAHGK